MSSTLQYNWARSVDERNDATCSCINDDNDGREDQTERERRSCRHARDLLWSSSCRRQEDQPLALLLRLDPENGG